MLTAVTGINWGDEGKGRVIDLLAENADLPPVGRLRHVRSAKCFSGVHAAGKTDSNLFRVCGRLGSRWRLCRLTDAAYPLRIKVCDAF